MQRDQLLQPRGDSQRQKDKFLRQTVNIAPVIIPKNQPLYSLYRSPFLSPFITVETLRSLDQKNNMFGSAFVNSSTRGATITTVSIISHNSGAIIVPISRIPTRALSAPN